MMLRLSKSLTHFYQTLNCESHTLQGERHLQAKYKDDILNTAFNTIYPLKKVYIFCFKPFQLKLYRTNTEQYINQHWF